MIELPKIPKPPGADQGPRWFQIAVALSMVLSAGAALVSAFRTSATMSALVEQNAKLVRAGSTPILQWGTSNSDGKGNATLIYTVENAGTGPARVVWMELRYKGEPLKSARDVIKAAAKDIGVDSINLNSTMTGSIAGDVLVAGRVRELFNWVLPDKSNAAGQRLWAATDAARQHLSAEACYCSVFDDCWLTKFDGQVPQPVAMCQAEGKVNVNGS
ncbi:hypothetical protein PFX98_02625 [Paucibacter sediminis]|uniref:Uncharacterized protein n=1 Tax=Paucibacter sediminis TaxID=3019553 RepID=A0AA95SLS3_9BURK|nr:hypothetical protein [Paucibacter sp. S2-9]WIT12518.1 hypothetical protein PFX98_02625 [Paucibacter sp. S2-9]